MKQLQAPGNWVDVDHPTIYLAGSFGGESWREEVAKGMKGVGGTLLNPWRDDWDPAWELEKDNPQVQEQVAWELDALQHADIIALYLSPDAQSPNALMELGLFCNCQMIVCCPEGFWRKENVDIICDRMQIEKVDTLKELIKALKDHLTAMRTMIWREQGGLGQK